MRKFLLFAFLLILLGIQSFAQTVQKTRTAAEPITTNGNIAAVPAQPTTNTTNLLNGGFTGTASTLTITGVTINGVALTVGSAYTIANTNPGQTGDIGTLTVNANGSYVFSVALSPFAAAANNARYNSNYGPIPLINYTVSNGETGSLQLTITPVNNGPANTLPAYNVPEDVPVVLNRFNTASSLPSISQADDAIEGNGLYSVTLLATTGITGSTPMPAGYGIISAADGNGTFNGVTVSGSGTESLLLEGTIAAVNAYLKDGGTSTTLPTHQIIYTPPIDARSTCYPIRLTITSNDNGNSGPGAPVLVRSWSTGSSDVTVRNITISSVTDIVADNIGTIATGDIKTFNVLTGTGGASADNFEDLNRLVTAINGTAVTNGETVVLPGGNTVQVNTDGTFTFTGVVSGSQVFSYTVTSPGCGCTETANVTINVTAPLPVTLINFTGKSNDCSILLNWATATEINFSHFEIEVSADGSNYTTAGTVQAKGFATGSSYSYKTTADNGIFYYRLRSVDIDGRYEYSPVVKVSSNCNNKPVVLFPNPTKGLINIKGTNSNDVIKVYDAAGKLVLQSKAVTGMSKADISDMAAGSYVLTISRDNKIILNETILKK